MLLASVGAHRHSDASVEKTVETRIREALYTLVDEIQIDLNPLS
jgi:hypothetical protein